MSNGYETRDAHVRPLVWFGVGLTALIIVSSVVSWMLEQRWTAGVAARSDEHPMDPFRATPSGPLLQPTTHEDLAEQRAEERDSLDRYGWIDAENGIVQLPIERAKELLLERGLTEREEGE